MISNNPWIVKEQTLNKSVTHKQLPAAQELASRSAGIGRTCRPDLRTVHAIATFAQNVLSSSLCHAQPEPWLRRLLPAAPSCLCLLDLPVLSQDKRFSGMCFCLDTNGFSTQWNWDFFHRSCFVLVLDFRWEMVTPNVQKTIPLSFTLLGLALLLTQHEEWSVGILLLYHSECVNTPQVLY